MENRDFKNYSELIEILRQRGVDISTSTLSGSAKKYLQRYGYYNLINGYKSLFLLPKNAPSDEDAFKSGTKLDEIVALFLFDKALRDAMLPSILSVETNIKSLITFAFSKEYGSDGYFKYINYDTNQKDADKNITALISEIQKSLASRYSDPSISHHLKKYGFVPLWVLNNILTLGTVSKFYSLMKQHERQTVAKTFHITEKELESALFYLSKVRNFCAHGNRLYCYTSKTPIFTSKYHATLNLNKNSSGEYIQGKNDLFAAIIILKILLSSKEFKLLVARIDAAINELVTHLSVLTKDEILNTMGFPANWKKL